MEWDGCQGREHRSAVTRARCISLFGPASAISDSTLYVYSKAEQGDHFLAFKNPMKFTRDLEEFLERKPSDKQAGEDDHDAVKETLLSASAAWNGAPYSAYPQGQPKLMVVKITVPAHGELPWHTHPVPSAAYVASGEITVEEKSGTKRHFIAGQVIPETVDTPHRGVVGDKPAVFIVFYPGMKGMTLSQPKQ